jgi:hypothetical protein
VTGVRGYRASVVWANAHGMSFTMQNEANFGLSSLTRSFNRLWGHGESASGADALSEEDALHEQARVLEREDLPSLLARYNREAARRPNRPRVTPAAARVFERSPSVVAIARRRR